VTSYLDTPLLASLTAVAGLDMSLSWLYDLYSSEHGMHPFHERVVVNLLIDPSAELFSIAEPIEALYSLEYRPIPTVSGPVSCSAFWSASCQGSQGI